MYLAVHNFPVVLLIIQIVILTLRLWMKFWHRTTTLQIKAIEKYFPQVLIFTCDVFPRAKHSPKKFEAQC